MSHPQATYTHGTHASVVRSHDWRDVDNSAAYLAADLRPGVCVLDVGCGPGSITVDIARRVAPGRVTAVDSSTEALRTAERTAARHGVDNVEFTQADAHDLRLTDATFDVVHAHQLLQHLADPVRALQELHRVCRPGGTIGARDADYAAMTWYPEIPELREWLSLYRQVARVNGGEPDAGRRLLAWAHAAGLTDVTCTTSTWCHATPRQRAWWSGVWSERIVDSDIATHARRSGLATESDLRRIAEGWRQWGDCADGWFAILHSEIRCRA